MNPFLRYLADKNSAHTQTDTHTDRHTPMTTRPCGLRRAGNYRKTSWAHGNTICLRSLQVDNIFVFIRQVAPVLACYMTRSTGWVSRSVSRSSYVCWHTSVCTVWHPTTCGASAHYWPPFLTVLCYVQLTQTNCWYHGPARPALDCVPSGSSGTTAWNDMPAHLRNPDLTLSDYRQLLKTTLFQTVPV